MKVLPTVEHLSVLAAIFAAQGKSEAADQALKIWEQCLQSLAFQQEKDHQLLASERENERLEKLAAEADAKKQSVKGIPLQHLGIPTSEAREITGYKTDRGFWDAFDAARREFGFPPRQKLPNGMLHWLYQEIITQEDLDLITQWKRKKAAGKKQALRSKTRVKKKRKGTG